MDRVLFRPDAEDLAHNMATYGRHYPWGTITEGNGSERCWVCGVRDSPEACFAWIPSPVQACSQKHAMTLALRAIEAASK